VTSEQTWLRVAGAVTLGVVALLAWVVVRKGRPSAPGDVFLASRRSSGNRLFPAQVAISKDGVVQHTPQWIGHREEVIHLAHVASVKIATGVVLSDIEIDASGGSDPILCHGRYTPDAAKIQALTERYQGEYYRNKPL